MRRVKSVSDVGVWQWNCLVFWIFSVILSSCKYSVSETESEMVIFSQWLIDCFYRARRGGRLFSLTSDEGNRRNFQWTGYCEASDVYSEGPRYESQPGQWLSWLEAFMLFLSSFIQKPGTAHGLGHDKFIPNLFTVHNSPICQSTLYVYNFKIWKEEKSL